MKGNGIRKGVQVTLRTFKSRSRVRATVVFQLSINRTFILLTILTDKHRQTCRTSHRKVHINIRSSHRPTRTIYSVSRLLLTTGLPWPVDSRLRTQFKSPTQAVLQGPPPPALLHRSAAATFNPTPSLPWPTPVERREATSLLVAPCTALSTTRLSLKAATTVATVLEVPLNMRLPHEMLNIINACRKAIYSLIS